MANNTRYDTIPVYPEDDNERREEETSLLKRPTYPSSFWRKRPCLSIFFAVISTFVITSTTLTLFFERKQAQQAPVIQGKKNVIMMISDGFGPASETFARQYYNWLNNHSVTTMLPLDEIHIGHSRTQSASSLVTDSAAGATAYACARKSYNGAVGVDPNEIPCGTVLESAKIHQEMLTGLVVTSRVTHATPAAFSSHVAWRDWEPLVAEQQIGYNPLGRTVDLMFGGGRCEFIRNSTVGSCRADDRDLLQEAKDKFGWDVVLAKEEYDKLNTKNVQLPLMALFAPGHMDFEMDRKPNEQPALHEMTRKALDILKAKSEEQDKGFFLMVEGSRIDMAAHNNDPAAHFHEILEYQKTAALVKEFVKENPNTIMISTSDHETGGLTAGRQVGEDYPQYLWYPERLSHVANSSEALAFAWDIACHKEDVDEQTNLDYLSEILIRAGLGIEDVTLEELEKIKGWITTNKTVYELAYMFSDMTSRRALIGWTTHGHTAVDVNLYAMGIGTEALRGSHENIEIGEFIEKFLELDLDDITKRLNDRSAADVKAFTGDGEKTFSDPERYHS